MKLGLPIQWQLGGAMLALGGLLSAVGATVFQFGPTLTGTWLTVVGVFFEGGGLMTVAFGFPPGSITVWVRRILLIAGALFVLEFVISAIQLLAPVVPASVSAVLFIASTAALLIAAVAIFRSPSIRGAVGWALLPAAAFETIDYFLDASGDGGQWWTLVILGVLFVVAGVVFAVRRFRPQARAARRR